MMIELSTENNSLICPDHKDGEAQAVFLKIGQHKAVLVKPQKFMYINMATAKKYMVTLGILGVWSRCT